MKRVYEGVLAVIFCLLLWLLLFLGGLALFLPGLARPWAFTGLNPLLLYLLQGLYLGLSLALALGIARALGRWSPLLRRGLSNLESGWQRLWG